MRALLVEVTAGNKSSKGRVTRNISTISTSSNLRLEMINVGASWFSAGLYCSRVNASARPANAPQKHVRLQPPSSTSAHKPPSCPALRIVFRM